MGDRIQLSVLICAILIAVTEARSELEVGDLAPPVVAKTWLNLPPGMTQIDEKDLQGQILVIEFWISTGEGCRQSVPFLNGLNENYRDRGVVLLALSHEPKSKVADFNKEHKVSYISGADAMWSFTAYGVSKIPTFVVVDPEGRVASIWHHPIQAMDTLSALLRKVPPHGSFRERAARSSLGKAAKYVESGKYAKAANLYEAIAEAFEGTHWHQDALARLKDLRSDKEIAAKLDEQKTRDACEKLLRKARKAAEIGDMAGAKKYYGKIIEDYEKSKYAAIALKEIKALDE